ncbi:hypothetical protein VTO42DRAFT_1216 [Malbranchea cinnamomea]
MIDHVLGRPSTKFRKIQVLAVVLFWGAYLLRGHRHGPPVLRLLFARFHKRMTSWQVTVLTVLTLYISRNFAKLVGLESPEPLANLYSRSYFRATWITTALDAGFWTAMNIRQRWLRDFCSCLFSLYYLFAAEQADEKVRRIRATLTVEHLRVSWNKATTPYLAFFGRLLRPQFTKYPPMAIRIPRPRGSSYTEPVMAWMYFNGPLSALQHQDKIVLDIPGGGFVAMNPRTSDDKLFAWAGRTGVPILSLDYKKAPEYPYPYALNECYDVYHTLVTTRGRCIGLSGRVRPKIVLTGDSAGGNLATGLTLMILQSRSKDSQKWLAEDVLPPPEGLVLIYPSLDMNIGSWMTDEQLSLIRDRGMRKTNKNVLRRKSEDYYRLTPTTSRHMQDEVEGHSVIRDCFSQQHFSQVEDVEMGVTDPAHSIRKPVPGNFASQIVATVENKPQQIRTRLAVSSMISYFNDRILTPEMMRAMIILYIGPYNRPDFSTDFLLSPLLAPEALLARFPKTYLLTGERDPLVDDTVIFAGRLRQAKLHRFRERQELGLEKSSAQFDEKRHVEVTLIPGISHGFLNFVAVFPEGWRQIFRCATWITDLFERAEIAELEKRRESSSALSQQKQEQKQRASKDAGEVMSTSSSTANGTRHHRRGLTGESSGDEDRPLEMMAMTKLSVRRGPSPKASSSSSTSSPSSSPPSSPQSAEPSSSPQKTLSPPAQEGTGSQASESMASAGIGAALATNPIFSPAATDLDVNSVKSDIASFTPLQSRRGSHSQPQAAHAQPNSSKRKHLQLQLPLQIQRKASLTSLPSEEDLLGRRMQGLAGGLMGIGEGATTP